MPIANSDYEREIINFTVNGGKVIFYGSVDRSSEKFMDFINVTIAESIIGECKLKLDTEMDIFEEYGYSDMIYHKELMCAGGINTVLKNKNSNVKALGYAEDRVVGTYGNNFA